MLVFYTTSVNWTIYCILNFCAQYFYRHLKLHLKDELVSHSWQTLGFLSNMRMLFIGLVLVFRGLNAWASWNASKEEYQNLTLFERRELDRYLTWCNTSDLGKILRHDYLKKINTFRCSEWEFNFDGWNRFNSWKRWTNATMEYD